MPAAEMAGMAQRAGLVAAAGADSILMPESLLDEVNALVEWPVVYACHFEDEFLAVPQECLILTMQTNQKYFALTDAAGKLRSRFLIVSNLETADPSHIISGNERVVRPRLSDAKFFFEQDKKKTLADRVPGLANVVYHNKLGTQGERTGRVTALAVEIAGMLGADGAVSGQEHSQRVRPRHIAGSFADHQHRHVGMMHHRLRDAPQQPVGQGARTPAADDDQIGPGVLCRGQQPLGRPLRAGHFVDCGQRRREPLAGSGQHALGHRAPRARSCTST